MKRIVISLLTSLLAMGGMSCSSTSGTSTSDNGSSTLTALCAYSGSGSQQLSYTHTDPVDNTSSAVSETLPYRFEWSCTGDSRELSGNGVPNHAVTDGNFASQITEQTVTETFPLSPVEANSTQTAMTPGFALNSVKFEPSTAGTCPDSATADTDCNYAQGSDAWRMEALAGDTSPWQFDFGTDTSNAHVQPTGTYHYHGMPTGLIDELNGSAEAMLLVGWAVDGFPIYAKWGYSDATDNTSALKAVEGSYQLKSTPDSGRPSTTYFPMGHFQQDWEYVANSGDLDECNGRVGVTPEFPEGIYHYYITESYPYIQRCLRGEAEVNDLPPFPPGTFPGNP